MLLTKSKHIFLLQKHDKYFRLSNLVQSCSFCRIVCILSSLAISAKYLFPKVSNFQDPQLPSIDHRARLRYDLNCKIQKLKLQNKFSIANVNTLINEYNESKQKIDSYVAPYSPNMMEILQQSEVSLK